MKKRFNNLSIFNKIALFTALIVVFISCVSTGLIIQNSVDTIRKKNELLSENAADEIYSFFLNKYNSLYNNRTLIHSSDFIADMIASTRDNPSKLYHPEKTSTIMDYFMTLCYIDSDIEDIILFTKDSKTAFAYSPDPGRSVYTMYDFNSLPYICEFEDSSATIDIYYDKAPSYLNSTFKRSKPVISFILKIFDTTRPLDHISVGYLIINYSPETVDATYQEINNISDGNYYVTNGQSQIIYSNIQKALNETYPHESIEPDNVVYKKMVNMYGLTVVACTDDVFLTKDIQGTIQRAFFTTTIGLLLIVIIISFINKYYANRFHYIADAMKEVSTGNFRITLPVVSNDEIGHLSKAFNLMSETLDASIKKNYLIETQKRTAELYALQAQINPHFLANTLECIRMHALNNKDPETASMLESLGVLFRWSIHFKQDIVYIEDELEYIQHYIGLHKFRFPDNFSVSWDIPSDIYYFGILKFTLQPIVENALEHVSKINQHLALNISFSRENSILYIRISDNGIGLSEEKLKRLREHIKGTQNHSEFGIALRNIHARYELFFGNPYGLNIESTYGKGTTITVTLPAKQKKELDKYV